jgi:hypothetical protein
MIYGVGSTPGLAYKGSEKSPPSLHQLSSPVMHKLKVTPKSWESTIEIGNILLLITLGDLKQPPPPLQDEN